MSSIVPLEEFEEVDEVDPDEFGFEHDFLFKITTPEETGEACSPDEVCDLILDEIEDQFWDWWSQGTALDRVPSYRCTELRRSSTESCAATGRPRRFKPRIKVYEVY